MVRISLIFTLLITCVTASTQYLNEGNAYLYNHYMINSAYANPAGKSSLYLSYNNQWASEKGTPSYTYFGFNTPLNTENTVGVRSVVGMQGVFENVLSEVTFSHKLQIVKEHWLYLGANAGLETYRLNKGSVYTADYSDPVLNVDLYKQNDFSAGIGVYYFWDKVFASAAMPQMLKNEHFIQPISLLAGYTFSGSKLDSLAMLKIQPSLAFRSVPMSPVQVDINIRTEVLNRLSAQLSYITNKSILAGIGCRLKDFQVGYIYEFNMGKLKHLSGGSHQVFITYDFNIDKDAIMRLLKMQFGFGEGKTDSADVVQKKIIDKFEAKEGIDYDSYYVVVGAYFNLEDAIKYRDFLKEKYNSGVSVIPREDGKYVSTPATRS